MPSINSPNCCLHWRYVHGPPESNENPWSAFPFDNAQFQELAGIDNENGLSVPPVGRVGASLSPRVREEWPKHAPGALKFLQYCDEQWRLLKKVTAFEQFEKSVLRTAPGCEDWAWVVLNTFGAPAGLNTQLDSLMKDAGCCGASAYRDARDRLIKQKARRGEEFREADVKVGGYEDVWVHGQTSLMKQVFGNAVLLTSGRVDTDYTGTLRAMTFRRFEAKRTSLHRRAKGMEVRESRLEAAVKRAEKDPSSANLRALPRLYANILALQREIGIEGEAESSGTWRARVDQLMEGMGRKLVNGKTVKIPRANKRGISVSDEEMDAIWQEYRDYIFSPPHDTPVLEDEAPEDESEPLKTFNRHLFEKDAGVQELVGNSEPDLIKGMGLRHGLPGRAEDENGKPLIEPSWHQWISAIAVIVNAFRGLPTLNADEVGLGKTIGVITVIQMLWHLIVLQQAPSWPNTDNDEAGYKWPKILGDSKTYMGLDKIPLAPTLVICPTTLTSQWKKEFEKCLDGKACRILIYRGNEQERDGFFAEGSEFDKAVKGDHPEHTVVIAEAPSVIQEGRRLLTMTGNPASGDLMAGDTKDIKKSIFGQRFLLGVLDEAHIYRNVGTNCHIMTTLMAQCTQRMLLTATPVFTHPRNLLSLGRMMRAPGFIGAAGEDLTKRFEKSVKKEMKVWNADQEHSALHTFMRTLYNPGAKASSDNTEALGIEDKVLDTEVNSYKSFWTSRFGMGMARTALGRMLIRRDNRSRDLNDQPLTSLHEKIASTSWIKLDEKTREMLEAQTASREARVDGRMDVEGFFTRLKKILVHPLLELPRPNEDADLTDDQWMQKCIGSVEAYQADSSPKINRLLELIQHHRGEERADAPILYWNRDGERIEGPQPKTAASPTKSKKSRRRKFVVYCHLSQSWKLVTHVLKLHGIETVQVNGSMEASQRDEAVKRFQSDDGPDVILLSNAGSQGLNLQRGSVVIFVDHPWSASEAQQVEGRVQRRGQTRDVIVYRIVAPDTPDEFLQGYATGKKLMMQVFTQECETRGKPGFELDSDDDVDGDTVPTKRAPSKLDPRKNKTETPDNGGGAEETSTSKSKSSGAVDAAVESSKTVPTASKRKPRASRARQPHPLMPNEPLRPKAGTRKAAEWDRRLALAIQENEARGAAAITAPADATAAHAKGPVATAKAKRKGKGKGKEDEHEDEHEQVPTPTATLPESRLSSMQLAMLEKLLAGSLPLDSAQSALAMLGETSIPMDVLIANGLGQVAPSGSGATESVIAPEPVPAGVDNLTCPISPTPAAINPPARSPAVATPSNKPASGLPPSREPTPTSLDRLGAEEHDLASDQREYDLSFGNDSTMNPSQATGVLDAQPGGSEIDRASSQAPTVLDSPRSQHDLELFAPVQEPFEDIPDVPFSNVQVARIPSPSKRKKPSTYSSSSPEPPAAIRARTAATLEPPIPPLNPPGSSGAITTDYVSQVQARSSGRGNGKTRGYSRGRGK